MTTNKHQPTKDTLDRGKKYQSKHVKTNQSINKERFLHAFRPPKHTSRREASFSPRAGANGASGRPLAPWSPAAPRPSDDPRSHAPRPSAWRFERWGVFSVLVHFFFSRFGLLFAILFLFYCFFSFWWLQGFWKEHRFLQTTHLWYAWVLGAFFLVEFFFVL